MTATLYKGSTSSFEAAQSAAVYEAVLTVLGATGTIVPLGDPTYRTGATTNTCAAGITGLPTAVFTASEAPESFDTPPTRQGICPIINFNESDEYFTSPDAAYWSRDDSGAAPVSMGAWVWLSATAGNRTLLSKYDNGNGREWLLYFSTSHDLHFIVRDESASAPHDMSTDVALATGRWVHVTVTYDGSGGANPLAGANAVIYVDGSAVADSVSADGTYVAMENGTGTVSIGSDQGNGSSARRFYFGGAMAGGATGPFFTQIELTAEQVKNIYRLQKAALAL